jgi:hypothetical protein
VGGGGESEPGNTHDRSGCDGNDFFHIRFPVEDST